jgi:hypothetical protein
MVTHRNELFWTEKFIFDAAVQKPEFHAPVSVRAAMVMDERAL